MLQQMQTKKHHQRQIRWACRRGMLELDKILLPFVDYVYDNLATAQQQSFVALLSNSDQELYQWLLGMEQHTPTDLTEIIQLIRAAHQQAILKPAGN